MFICDASTVIGFVEVLQKDQAQGSWVRQDGHRVGLSDLLFKLLPAINDGVAHLDVVPRDQRHSDGFGQIEAGCIASGIPIDSHSMHFWMIQDLHHHFPVNFPVKRLPCGSKGNLLHTQSVYQSALINY